MSEAAKSFNSLKRATVFQNDNLANNYARQTKKRLIKILFMSLCLLSSFFLDILSGPGNYPLTTIFEVMLSPLSHGVRLKIIFWDYRLPIALTAVVVGAMLAVSGAQMQTILNNSLASPFTLGISSGASFGAALAIVFGISFIPAVGPYLVTANSFIFALLTAALILLATRMKGVTTEVMILFGIAIMFAFSALLSFLQYMASDDQISHIIFWMMGSLTRASWNKVLFASILLALLIPFNFFRAWQMTALRMGEASAASMGVNVSRLRVEMLMSVSLLAATAVSFVGTVGFVGLVAPHIARILVGEDQRYFVPTAALTGAFLLSFTSWLSKTITPGILYPIGIITSLIGIPFFISALFSVRKERLS